MFGNGVPIGTELILLMGKPIRRVLQKVRNELFAAVRGVI